MNKVHTSILIKPTMSDKQLTCKCGSKNVISYQGGWLCNNCKRKWNTKQRLHPSSSDDCMIKVGK